jgi:hypothetical protein
MGESHERFKQGWGGEFKDAIHEARDYLVAVRTGFEEKLVEQERSAHEHGLLVGSGSFGKLTLKLVNTNQFCEQGAPHLDDLSIEIVVAIIVGRINVEWDTTTALGTDVGAAPKANRHVNVMRDVFLCIFNMKGWDTPVESLGDRAEVASCSRIADVDLLITATFAILHRAAQRALVISHSRSTSIRSLGQSHLERVNCLAKKTPTPIRIFQCVEDVMVRIFQRRNVDFGVSITA